MRKTTLSRFLTLVVGAAIATVLMPAGAEAQLPEGVTYDYGSFWMELENQDRVEDNQPVDDGWRPRLSARVLGSFPAGSSIRFVLKQGDETLGDLMCEATATETDLSTGRCYQREMRIRVDGDVQVEVRVIHNLTEVESLVATHTVRVVPVARWRNPNLPGPNQHYIVRHGETPVMTIEQVPNGARSSVRRGRARANAVLIYMTVNYEDRALRRLSLRCLVNGEPIAFRPEISASRINEVVAQQRTVVDGRVVPEYFRTQYLEIQLPLSWDEGPSDNRAQLDEHPGAWECHIRNDQRQVGRTFRFTTDESGTIQPHAEEAAGLTLAPGVHLLDVDIPADSVTDARTDPAQAAAGGFYGRPWVSPEARAMAGRVPAIGEPVLSSSVPAEPARRNRRRRRR